MRVGPMPLVAADKMMRLLRKHGHEAELIMGDDPQAQNPNDSCFIEFDESYLEFVRKDLVRLALISVDDEVSTGTELDVEEWLCPKCGKSFDHPGTCPVHALPLVSFEDYAGGAKAEASKLSPAMVMLIIFVVGAVLYAMKR